MKFRVESSKLRVEGASPIRAMRIFLLIIDLRKICFPSFLTSLNGSAPSVTICGDKGLVFNILRAN